MCRNAALTGPLALVTLVLLAPSVSTQARPGAAKQQAKNVSTTPLVLAKQGSFFVKGDCSVTWRT